LEDASSSVRAGEELGGFFLCEDFVAKAGEGGKDVFDVVSFDAVKQKIRGVKLGKGKAK